MQTTIKKSIDSKVKKDKLPKEEQRSQDEKLKKTPYSTPRNYLQKSSAADIYGQIKKDSISSTRAPKKVPNTTNKTSNASPMKGLLKSTPSSTSVTSINREKTKMAVQKKTDAKTTPHSSKVKDFNVTVNSPVVKKRLNLDKEKSFIKSVSKKEKATPTISSVKNESQRVTPKATNERQRTKTRTLLDDEVKILTPEAVDNNKEMLNLSKKLSAVPKAYFIDLEDKTPTKIEQPSRPKTPSDEEISYEDDFESYESDFESYHSSSPSDQNISDDKSEEDDDDEDNTADVESKEVKDEERMLDSGSFDLRDQRSANKTKPVLDFILESTEEAKRSSLTDEGFLEMSSSSAVSSIRTVHTDVVERPLFIDFTKSQETKRKKKINERLKQRAKDLLSIITLHEMSYSLFEMKPISYDLFMATFGKSNYQQISVQTFDDGITEEIQTEEIESEHKWTQHPVEFSKKDVCISNRIIERKFSKNTEDYLTKFTFLTKVILDVDKNNEININENYKTDPLRIYFEQKDGVGPSEMLPYEVYKTKLKNNDFNTHRLGKFLKKFERRISNILNINSGDTELSELKMSKLSFSKGYISISSKNITDSKMMFLSKTKISKAYFSENKNNLILSVHNKPNTGLNHCIICLWDISVARREPTKILTAITNVAIGRFRGAADGFFVAALEDGSIHLWDLSEQPTWRPSIADENNSQKLEEVNHKNLTPFERDREWNKLNSHIGVEDTSNILCPLQACAFTNSAFNMSTGEASTSIVGLEFTGDQVISQEGRKVVGQVAALQKIGILTIWSIIQEKSKNVPPDIGKAFWSKMKLERNQTINLLDYIDSPLKHSENNEFNLNAAKRRIISRKQEKIILKSNSSRLKSAFDINKPASAASGKNKKVLPVQTDVSRNWENGIVCYDLKVVLWRNGDSYLIARNCGEVLCCRRTLGVISVNRISVTAVSSVTCIEASPHRLPYYLASTDSGTISVCSLNENRVLLTLDCRNIPAQDAEKYYSDDKGRYIGSASIKSPVANDTQMDIKLRVTSLSWSYVNPCHIFATINNRIVCWDLTHSDIYAKSVNEDAAISCIAADNNMALLTPEGDIQIHKLTKDHKTNENLTLFEKYITLL